VGGPRFLRNRRCLAPRGCPGTMAQNKKYSASLQKLRMQGSNVPDVDPALNSYILMLLRSSPVNAIDAKDQPVVRPLPAALLPLTF
jgi:hypothetical protein